MMRYNASNLLVITNETHTPARIVLCGSAAVAAAAAAAAVAETLASDLSLLLLHVSSAPPAITSACHPAERAPGASRGERALRASEPPVTTMPEA